MFEAGPLEGAFGGMLTADRMAVVLQIVLLLTGAFVLALQTGVPVVPVGVSGSRDIMPKGSWRIRSGTIRVRIGPPIPVVGRGEGARDALLEEARGEVERLRQPPLEAGRGE